MNMSKNDMTNKLTRRNFIKSAAAGAGAAAIMGMGLKKAEAIPVSRVEGKWSHETDVLVAGAGGGGLSAAIEAADAGAKVLVLDVMVNHLLSNTAICGGVVMGANTSMQKEAGVSDSAEEFEKYLTAVGGEFDDPELRKILAQKSGDTIEWLAKIGVKFPVKNLYISGSERDYADITTPKARGHITDAHSGRPISEALFKTAKEKNVAFMFRTRVTRLITNQDKEIVGVKAVKGKKELFIKAKKGVVLATAGFSRNSDYILNFMPKLLTGGSFGSPWQKGDGITMGMSVGAKLTTMWAPQAATIGIPTTKRMTPCMVITIWGNPCLMVARDGKRHFREDYFYEILHERISEQPGGFVWTLWDQKITDLGGQMIAVPAFSKDLSVEVKKGWVKKANTIRELAGQMNVDPDQLEKTVQKYNKDAEAGQDTQFEKKVGLGSVAAAPYYAAKTVPAVADTAGGLTIKGTGQVLDVYDQVIPRLYATGSTTGAWRGKTYAGSGNAVSFAVTFGRLAGKHVAGLKPWS
jgi:flavocytochrome c